MVLEKDATRYQMRKEERSMVKKNWQRQIGE